LTGVGKGNPHMGWLGTVVLKFMGSSIVSLSQTGVVEVGSARPVLVVEDIVMGEEVESEVLLRVVGMVAILICS
jgi:hypothetical protein